LAEQEAAVLGDGVAGAEGHVVIGLAVDVRDVELVAADLEAGPPGHGLGAHDRPRLHGLGLEVARQHVVGDVVAQRRERVVHLRLALGAGDGSLVLARRQDVQRRGG
jgi:hypothetical protein